MRSSAAFYKEVGEHRSKLETQDKTEEKKKSALSQNQYIFHYRFQNTIAPLSVMLAGDMQDLDNTL
jgi:hypothetical protein